MLRHVERLDATGSADGNGEAANDIDIEAGGGADTDNACIPKEDLTDAVLQRFLTGCAADVYDVGDGGSQESTIQR